MAFAILLLLGFGFLLLDSGLNNTSLLASFQKFLPNLSGAK